MKINTTELRNALAIVKPGLSNKEILEQTTSFAFLEGRVVTYNDEISISHPFKCDFEGAIKAEELYGLLTKINKDEVELRVEEAQLLISSGRMKAGLKLESEINLPLKDIPVKMQTLPNPEQFIKHLAFAMRTCSNDTSTPKLTCVSIGKDGVIIGADNYRLIYCKGDAMPFDSFLLPASNAVEVVKLSPTYISLEKGWVHFKNKSGTVISCRRLDDEYMSSTLIEKALKIDNPITIQFPDKIQEMLDRIRQFAKRERSVDEVVDIEIQEGKIYFNATAEMTGSWIQDKAAIEIEGDLAFSVNPSLLHDILEVTLTAKLSKDRTKIKFSTKDWDYVIMLHNPETREKSKVKKK